MFDNTTISFVLSMLKLAKEEAKGIPSLSKYPTPPKAKGRTWQLAIQEHHAEKAGKHLDIRLIDSKGRVYSWALKGELPKPGEKIKVVEQPAHTKEYATWEGVIEKGYGKGTVKLKENTRVDLIESSPDKISFVIPKGKVAEEYTLVRINNHDWILVNHTTTKDKYPIEHIKPKYREEDIDRIVFSDSGTVFSAKLSGAHAIVILQRDKRPRVFSYRKSKQGIPLEYTHKMPMSFRTYRWDGPNVILRAEVIAVDKNTGRVLPEQTLAGILNSTVEKAQQTLRENNYELRLAPFMVWSVNGKRFEESYDKHLDILKQVARKIPATELPDMAFTVEEKKQLLKKIIGKKHPQTEEGIVIWDIQKATPTKAKVLKEYDVYVRGIFFEKGRQAPVGIQLNKRPGTKYIRRFRQLDGSIKYEYDDRPLMAAGFYYSLTPNGPIVGKVGTGFSHLLKKYMAAHPKNIIGLVAKVKAERQLPSGALFKPSFIGWHYEKSPTKVDKVPAK